MSNNAGFTQPYAHLDEDNWAWGWTSPAAAPAFSLPLSHQSPMYRSPSAASSQMSAPAMPWLPSPASSVYSPMTNNLPSDFDTSPVEPLMNDFPVDFDLDPLTASLGDLSQSWPYPGPDAAASMDFFTPYLQDAAFPAPELAPDFTFAPGVDVNHFTPPGSVSPTASLFATPLIGSHLGAPTPASLPSPAAPAAPTPSQLLPCPEPTCSKVYRTLSELKYASPTQPTPPPTANHQPRRKHQTKSHRPARFLCPLPGCAKPHKDQRSLNRHLHAQHTAYAAKHNIPSEKAGCPHCGAAPARADNMARHMKSKHRDLL